MQNKNDQAVRDLLLEAMDKPPQERQRFLDDACGDDADLRKDVESLAAALEARGEHFFPPTHQGTAGPLEAIDRMATEELMEAAGTTIGRYRLLQLIGEGGFGMVYMAEQQTPVHRRVALKVIKLGMDTKQVIARFEAERQALALMDHPNIAKVLDAGATDAGRPYFVMELVQGVPITDYCDQVSLYTRQRLELFAQVCRAVQHAHQKGIIHRDLKPSNVLVTLHDGVPVPKVIDFGIAKATHGQRLTEKTLFTEFRQMVGTPEYMAPEQAGISGLDVDTRSDVYGLGVLLYELLTGTTPFEARELRARAHDEIQRIIREVEPPNPSTRLSTLAAATAVTVAARRGTEPRKLGRLVHGELDWIVMKCLEKERGRRYPSALGLAEDLERWLRAEPIGARPVGPFRKAAKWARRKPATAALAAVTAAALLLLLAAAVAVPYHLRLQSALAATGAARKREAHLHEKTLAALGEAEWARAGEQAQRKLKETALEESERYLYVNRISLAQREWTSNDVGRAERILDDCPPPLRQWEWHYLKHLCRLELLTVSGHADGVESLAFSPDGSRIAVISGAGALKVWDSRTGSDGTSFHAAVHRTCVAFHPDGHRLAVGHKDGTVEVWEWQTGRRVYSFGTGSVPVTALAFGKSPPLLATASGAPHNEHAEITVWDPVDGRPLRRLPGHPGQVNSIAISADGSKVATAGGTWAGALPPGPDGASRPGEVRLWNTATGETTATLAANTVALSVAFSPRGDRLAAGHADQVVRVWKVESGTEEAVLSGHGGAVHGVAFSPDGDRLASACDDRTVRLWHVSRREVLASYCGHSEALCVAFDPAGGRIASGGADGVVRLWRDSSDESAAKANPGRAVELGAAGQFPGVAFGADRERLAAAAHKTLYLLDPEGVAEAIKVETDGYGYGPRVSFSRDGSLVALNHPTEVSIRRAGDGALLTLLPGLGKNVYDTAFSPDGRFVAACFGDDGLGEVKVWEWSTGRLVRTFKIEGSFLWAVAWSPDGRHLAAAGGAFGSGGRWGMFGGVPNDVWVWDVWGESLVHRLKGHVACVWDLAFSSDGSRLASVAGLYQGRPGEAGERRGEGELKVWDIGVGLEVLSLPLPMCPFSVTFSPDDRWLACAGGIRLNAPGGKVLLFGTAPGSESLALLPHGQKTAYSVAFSRNGKRIAAASGRGTISLWNMDEVTGLDAPRAQGAVVDRPPDTAPVQAATSP
jgi:WD40 repeat protein